jgi:type I restriction enzyme, S subunit
MNQIAIKDLAYVSSGSTAPKEKYFSETGIPFIRAGHLQKLIDGFPISELPKISEEYEKELKLKKVKKGTILFAKSGMSSKKNRIYQCRQEAYIVNHLAAITPDNTLVDSDYLRYFLKWFNPSRLIIDESYPSIRLSDISNIQINLLSLKDQKRIVDVLNMAQNLSDLRKHQIAEFSSLRKSLFLEMFGDLNTNKYNFPVAELGEICPFIKDGPHVSPNYTNEGVPFISVNNIIKDKWDFEDVKFISEEDYEKFAMRCKPEQGDILYTKGGTTGFAKYIDIETKFINWVHLAVLKYDKSIINGIFLTEMLNSPFCYAQAQRYTRGIANRDLVLGQMKKIKVLIPPLSKQEEFVSILNKIKAKNILLENSLIQFENNTHSLLQRAFRGDLFK